LLNSGFKVALVAILALAAIGLATSHWWFAARDAASTLPDDTAESQVQEQAREWARRAGTLLLDFERSNDTAALEAAATFSGRAISLAPDSPSALLAAGRVLDAGGRYSEARDVLHRISDSRPEESTPSWADAAIAATFLPEGDLGAALTWTLRAQATAPDAFELGGRLLMLNDCLENYAAAAAWSDWLDGRVTNQPSIMAQQARHHYLTGNFEAAIQTSNIALRLGLARNWQARAVFMRIKRDEALARGAPRSGIDAFRAYHPELFVEHPIITPENISQAIDLAYLLKMERESETARRLLQGAIEAYDQPHFTDGSARAGLAPARAEAFAVQGNTAAALDELRRVLDSGWRLHWRWETEMNANFNTVRDTGEFQALLAELESDIARQRTLADAITGPGGATPGAAH
jgi:tetratricopeptide (TPR) repeat protein